MIMSKTMENVERKVNILSSVQVQLKDIKPNEKNYRIHNARQIEQLAKSVKLFGQTRPIILDENNVIIAGHALWEALLKISESEPERQTALCAYFKGTEKEKLNLLLADNRIYELGMIDFGKRYEILKALDFDLNLPAILDVDLDLQTALNFVPAETSTQDKKIEPALEQIKNERDVDDFRHSSDAHGPEINHAQNSTADYEIDVEHFDNVSNADKKSSEILVVKCPFCNSVFKPVI